MPASGTKSSSTPGTRFQRQSNLDIKTGEPIPPDDMRMIYQKANYLWHSDSSFKRIPSLCSVLTARICPPEGGNTEFLCMRAAWQALPPALQATLASMQIGQTTQPFGAAKEGISVLVLCGRDMPQTATAPDLQEIENRLLEEKVNKRAQRYLRDLRRDAVIEYS